VFFFIISCKFNQDTSSNKFLIKAEIKGLNNSTQVFIYNTENYNLVDSTIVVNEHFNFEGTLEDPIMGLFYFKDKLKKKYPSINFWIENSNISIKANLNDFQNGFSNFKKNQIEGTELNEIYIDYQNKLSESFELQNNELNEIGNRNLSNEIINKYIKIRDSISFDLAYNSPNNHQSLSIIFNSLNEISNDSLRLYYNKLDNKYKDSKIGKLIRVAQESIYLSEGDEAPEIIGWNLDDKFIKLSDFKGTTVLLDFWSSTCSPCRKQNKNEFSRLSKKYKNLSIVSYSLDSNKEMWKRASEEDNITWINFSELKGYKSKFIVDYNIRLLPTSFLIDNEGIIRKKFIGYVEGQNSIEKELIKLFAHK
jgi:thiol-disulfide isomerase/thioredoxin